MEFRCKLSEVNDMLDRLREAVNEPLRIYEVPPTERTLRRERSMVCESDYTVCVPELKLFFREAVEFVFDEAKQDDLPAEEIRHCYREGDKEPIGGDDCSVRDYVLRYIKDAGLSIKNAEELECVIDMPYDVNLKED